MVCMAQVGQHYAAKTTSGNHSTPITINQTAKSALKKKADIKLIRFNFLKNMDLTT